MILMRGSRCLACFAVGVVALLDAGGRVNAELIDVLNDVIDPTPPSYQTDTDRSDVTNPSDVLRVIDLLNGAGAYDVYLGATLPE